ncbi:beta-ketoacyl synthase N-terminal-like domain-containing protein [Burkholderia stagnalis]|uniref:3-oxoacyl-[acyl-carrier-protein] synthase 1 n=1 Tax=Burkholderia stagnalis TaxID=1503054 RepID=A0ABX9YV29_9BURK|nr:beta-ketoacyl synthase N-terminal-like domain-containing protein [Burkholderia stagnalis]MDY7800979.1 beta-ketoacyl synthase N-terminal-like domain-containing protein [Burkholderia stagnalis]RQQ65780.1 beta-ketoacyl-ACP synthase I [Burkholderia stagnalis]RQQ74258.1 beta-ketoacyl-ACP synthase I [Burkholderia stagnalis]RQQ76016.1 beta-ketoacyl-ACP synthase I [Burkholderia stagnalis]RQQ85060.1 beta-ketoacyl-ACP synthase I [Burkholderia stagnalis]
MTRARGASSRVVVTGLGIVSCLGNALADVSAALRDGRSAVRRVEAWQARGFRSQVAGVATVDAEPPFARKHERFMGDTARFAAHAAARAIVDAGLDPAALRSPRAGAIIGSGIGSIGAYDDAMAIASTRGVDRTPPYVVPKAMSSTASACVAQAFGIEGVAYSPSSACTSSTLAIGQAMQLIRAGAQDVVLAGGSEALHDNMTLMFDAMGALSGGFNDCPERASRPYGVGRDGFVIASGAGILVLESLDHAMARGARIYAELTGFGQCTDNAGMATPHAPGIARAMRAALAEARAVPDYVNTHAPSTPLGDVEELKALSAVFGGDVPAFSSTKAMTGHPLGASGVHELIYTILMMRDGFIAGTAVDGALDPALGGLPVVRTSRDARIARALSVSFGFGGSCASVLLDAWKGD